MLNSYLALRIAVDNVVNRIASRISLSRQRGQGMVEYALILVLIAVVVIVVLGVTGKRVNNVFSNVSKGLSG